jgi:two-component system NtrC family sensor kinase
MTADHLAPDVLLAALLAAMENASIGCTVVVDPGHGQSVRREYANAPAAAMFGMTVDELQKTPPMLALAVEERTRMTAIRAAGGIAPVNMETKIVRADGSVLPIEVSMGIVPLAQGQGQAIVAFLRDLTPRLTMETALRESEERFRTIAESCPDSITVVSDERYVYANPPAMRVLRVTSQEELLQIDLNSTAPEERRAEIAARRARVLRGEPVGPLQLHSKIDGRDVFIEVSTRLTTFSGRPAIASYTRDITDRRELQARLMQQDRLAAVGTLAAGLAHELNNPLTYLAFHLERLGQLMAAHSSGEEKEALGQIQEGTKRMQSVIADLLFLTRDSARPQAHVDVAKILRSTISLVQAGASTATRITSDLATTSMLLGHPSRLGQVFLNVILNALEAIGQREDGLVHVTLCEREGWLEIAIADNGPGLVDESRARVFDPFFSTKPEGTGLGLSISHAIVTAHGGTIAMASPPNGGAVVTVCLPTESATSQRSNA